MRRITAYIILTIITLTFNNVWSQITAGNTSFIGTTKYSSPPQDDYYCFSRASDIKLLTSPDRITWQWMKFNEVTKEWDIPSGNSNELTPTEQGGYQVIINEGLASEETDQCWVFIPKITGTGSITTKPIDCGPVVATITGFTITELAYYDFRAPAKNKIIVPYQYHWNSTENFITDTTTTTATARLNIYYNTTLNAWVDGFEIPKFDATPLAIEAKAVKAKFDTTEVNGEIPNQMDPDVSNGSRRSAPLDVSFIANPDKNLRSMGENLYYEWIPEDFPSTDHNSTFNWTYKEPGDYVAKLALKNKLSNCVDTFSINIGVTDTYMMVPNVFTPNGDGANDEFRVSYRSVKDFNITIVNRWGRIVYKSDELDKGWDGRISGKEAAPGVYYYDVKWTGFDGTKGDRQGFLHLLTGKR